MNTKEINIVDEDECQISESGYTFHDIAIEDSIGISDAILNNFKFRARDIEEAIGELDEGDPIIPLAHKAIDAFNSAYALLPQIKTKYTSM